MILLLPWEFKLDYDQRSIQFILTQNGMLEVFIPKLLFTLVSIDINRFLYNFLSPLLVSSLPVIICEGNLGYFQTIPI